MSSYFKANRDYQRIHEARMKKVSEDDIHQMAFGNQKVIRFPLNVNIGEFIQYLVYPTLTY